MSLLVQGRITQFVIVILLYALGYYFIKKGEIPRMRTFPALEAITEGIGRSEEMGKPVWYDPGQATITGIIAAQTFAGFSVMSHIAKLTARHGIPLFTTLNTVQAIPLMESIIYEAYASEGKGDEFSSDMVNYMPVNAAVLGKVLREKPGCAILVGAYYSESITRAETASRVGAMVISGTATTHNIPFLFLCSDYTLIGEEIFAASAFLSGDVNKLGCLVSQDIGKYLAIVLMIVGAIASAAGSNIVSVLLGY